MNEQLSLRMKPSMGIVYHNAERMSSKPLMRITTNTAFFQQLEEVRNELKQVRKERDSLRMALLDCVQIF
jgi:hypothetical protein